MFDKLNYEEMISKAQEFQKRMAEDQENKAKQKFEASSGGGMVSAVMSGKLELLSLKIDPEVIDREEKSMLEDLVRAAVNECLRKAHAAGGAPLSDMVKNFDISQLKDMFSK